MDQICGVSLMCIICEKKYNGLKKDVAKGASYPICGKDAPLCGVRRPDYLMLYNRYGVRRPLHIRLGGKTPPPPEEMVV